MEILVRTQAQPVEVVLYLSLWEAEALGPLLSKLSTESISKLLEVDYRESVLPAQIFGITSEIYWALVKDPRVNVGDPWLEGA